MMLGYDFSTTLYQSYVLFSTLVNMTYQSGDNISHLSIQFVIFKPLSYCFEETIEFDVKALLAMRPVSRLIKPGNITKEF